jgi:hypothetical protein
VRDLADDDRDPAAALMRVAAVQLVPVIGDVEANLDACERLVGRRWYARHTRGRPPLRLAREQSVTDVTQRTG